MKHLFLIIISLIAGCLPTAAFYRGADISWYTEMEAGGLRFYGASGVATECNELMRQCGMNAIRLRVWVEPTMGGWCGTEDVVRKAVAAKAAGHEVLIDFHYSDFFADPSRQAIPAAWQGLSLKDLAARVADHTTQVLTALKTAGVTPRWVQLGNETRNGMLYSRYNASSKSWVNAGGITGSTSAQYGGGWQNYATLSNAGYDAAKAVFPSVQCIVHLDTRGSDTDLSWWFTPFLQAGGKVDMVGLSHYPMPWANSEATATTSGRQRNANLMTIMDNTHRTVNVPFMVVETGVYVDFTTGGRDVMADLLQKAHTKNYCEGVFYWEPEQYNWWKPAVYADLGWNNYNMAAFLTNGRPSAILDAFINDAQTSSVMPALQDAVSRSQNYDLQGRPATPAAHGVIIRAGQKIMRK